MARPGTGVAAMIDTIDGIKGYVDRGIPGVRELIEKRRRIKDHLLPPAKPAAKE